MDTKEEKCRRVGNKLYDEGKQPFEGKGRRPWEKRNCMRRKVVELEPIDAI